MELVEVVTAHQKSEFINFVYHVYAGNPCYKDTLMPILRNFLYQRDVFVRASISRPIAVVENGVTQAQAILFFNSGLPLLQIAFFEAREGAHAAVERLVAAAMSMARGLGLSKIIIGLNGHLQYGVGLLTSNFETPARFDTAYSPPHYPEYFRAKGFEERRLTTYFIDLNNWHFDERCVAKIHSRYQFRTMRPGRFRDDMLIFSKLCNETLADTEFYYRRPPEHLVDLVSEMRIFLKPENLIFACKDGVEIGYIFWHPDFNQAVRGGQKNSLLRMAFDIFTGGGRINTIKLNTLGVLPKYRRGGVAVALIHEMIRLAKPRYPLVETNFVWDSNVDCRGISEGVTDRVASTFSVFLAPVGEVP